MCVSWARTSTGGNWCVPRRGRPDFSRNPGKTAWAGPQADCSGWTSQGCCEGTAVILLICNESAMMAWPAALAPPPPLQLKSPEFCHVGRGSLDLLSPSLSAGGPMAHQGERCTLPTSLSGGSGDIEEEEKWWRRERENDALGQSKDFLKWMWWCVLSSLCSWRRMVVVSVWLRELVYHRYLSPCSFSLIPNQRMSLPAESLPQWGSSASAAEAKS